MIAARYAPGAEVQLKGIGWDSYCSVLSTGDIVKLEGFDPHAGRWFFLVNGGYYVWISTDEDDELYASPI